MPLPCDNIRSMRLIYLSIVSVFFPLHISLLGRDAISTSTICIFVLFIKYLFDSFNQRNFIKEKYDYWVYLLILLSAVSVFYSMVTGMIAGEQIGQAVRRYVGFLSAMLLFIVIKNYQLGKGYSQNQYNYILYIERLLTLFLVLISIHIFISITVKFFPSLSWGFDIFLPRDVEFFDSVDRDRMQRISSFVFNYEQYGEILAALSPIVIYKIYRSSNIFWVFCFLLFALGLMFSVTRSGILLFVVGVFISILYHFNSNRRKSYLLICIALIFTILIHFSDVPIVENVYQRFKIASETYASTGNIVETINRGKVFYDSWELVVSNLNLLGNCITGFHFHNLYFSTIYQIGIVGLFIFCIVIIFPAINLIKIFYKKKYVTNKELVFSCLLSLIIFFINEMKFEFTRHSIYQQIWWGIIAVYCLVSKASSPKVYFGTSGKNFFPT